MTILDAIILGLVEGITEYLPVSSTGHLIIAAWLLGLGRTPEDKAAIDAFNVIIQGGAILAVLGLYRARVAMMVRGLLGRDPKGLRLFLLLLVAFLPAAILGVLLDDLIEAVLFHPIPVLTALFVGGVLLIAIKPWQQRLRDRQAAGDTTAFRSMDDLRFGHALLIGLMQCVAMIPGTSRSMMTILGGLVVRLSPKDAAEFSFLLGLPTLGGACVLKLSKQLRDNGLDFVDPLGGWLPVGVGIVTAMLSAAVAITWLVRYLERHSFVLFGVWRIALALVLGGAILSGAMSL
jgi:undecaprenyl-diphosphatase